MTSSRSQPVSARRLRAELGARNLLRGQNSPHEVTFGSLPSVVYQEDGQGNHGNFLPASYRRILANADWARRLGKTYTGSARVPRSGDRWRGELECAGSSDALLMNVFCYPGVVRRRAVCARLGASVGQQPAFGVRAHLPMRNAEVDRTELDMRLGEVLVEAKLTEGGFGRARRDRLLRYSGLGDVFDLDALPTSNGVFNGYQLIRGILAALHWNASYLVLLDGRRADLVELCFGVSCAVRHVEVRSKLRLLTWQELATALPRTVQRFLAEKYGIEAAR